MQMKYLNKFPIETERLILRLINECSAQDWFDAIAEHPEHFHAWNAWNPYEMTFKKAAEILKRNIEGTLCGEKLGLAVYEKDTGAFVGDVAATSILQDEGIAEIGYWIRSSASGRGYMYESLKQLCTFLYEEVQMKHIIARVHPSNQKSLALLERLKFKPSGEKRDIIDGVTGETVEGLVYKQEV